MRIFGLILALLAWSGHAKPKIEFYVDARLQRVVQSADAMFRDAYSGESPFVFKYLYDPIDYCFYRNGFSEIYLMDWGRGVFPLCPERPEMSQFNCCSDGLPQSYCRNDRGIGGSAIYQPYALWNMDTRIEWDVVISPEIFESSEWARVLILHELMHTLGLGHEDKGLMVAGVIGYRESWARGHAGHGERCFAGPGACLSDNPILMGLSDKEHAFLYRKWGLALDPASQLYIDKRRGRFDFFAAERVAAAREKEAQAEFAAKISEIEAEAEAGGQIDLADEIEAEAAFQGDGYE